MDVKALIEELNHSRNYAIKQMEEFPEGSDVYWHSKGILDQCRETLGTIYLLLEEEREQNEREDLPEHDPEQKHWEDLSTHYERFSGD